ncbi:MAG: putative bifunctional diguanylate cyclase/phosphodiesterase [Streptosporangiaceae bacterium]
MKDPRDTRDTCPRVGSPLWIYLTAVTVAGLATLGLAMTRLTGLAGGPALAAHPLFWVMSALIVAGRAWPIVAPGRPGPQYPAASLTFSFAVLLCWGLPLALLLPAAAVIGAGLAQRRRPNRIAFNVGQITLSMTAAAVTILALRGHLPSPADPWQPSGWQLAVFVAPAAAAYFAVNYLLVGVAAALHARAPVLRTLRAGLGSMAVVSLILLATAPLVTAVMASGSALLALLFAVPLAGVYINAAISVQRQHQAHHDELTGLCNRKLLVRQAGEALETAAAASGRAGFLLLDLDRFKEVNDTLGHAAGDRLLRVVASRLTRSVRPGDVVARLGGDEFAVLLPSVPEISAAGEVAARLHAALAEPVRLDGMSLEIEASIGIALYPDDATGFDVLMQRADVAMYLAKERRSGIERYVAGSDRNSPARLALLGDLRRGLDQRQLELHFQPKVSLTDRSTIGMEALVRWHHPARGLMAPEQFIPLVEQSYLMRDLTAAVVDMTLAQAALWWQDGMPVQVSLNVAARDLMDATLPETVSRALSRHQLPPEALLLELNERALTAEPARAATNAETLARLGVCLSLDDFGTGYSSLIRLKRLPVSEVKIDSSFVGRMLASPDDEVIVRSVVELVRALGIRSVAEGVESAETATALRAMGCMAAQGWHFSRPLNAVAATAWLAERGRPERPATTAAAGTVVPRPAGPRPVTRSSGPRAAASAPAVPAQADPAQTPSAR